MNKPLEKHNCTGRYRVIAMALVLAMVITYMLPAGTYRTFGENADTASGDGLMGPNSASGSVFEEGSAASAAGTSAPALNGGAETPSAPASNKGDDGEGSDIGRFDVPDFGNVFGATADDNLKLAPIPDIRAGSVSEDGLEKAPADTVIQSLGETVVNDWAGLRTAIADASVSKIIFGGDITRSDANYLGYINRDLEIDGAGFILNNKQNGSTNTNQSVFFLGAGKTATLKLCNMEVIDGASGGDNGQSFIGTQYNTSNTTTFYSSNREAAHGNNSQHWNIEIENVWQSQPDPENPVMFPGTVTCGMVAACDATVTFSGRVSWSANSNTRVVNARDLTFAEDSVTDFAALGGPDYIAVDGYPTIWIYASTPSRDDTLTVKDGAHLTVYSQNSQAIILGDGAEGTITTRSNATYPYAEVTISGEDTLLYCYSDAHYGTGNGTTTYECPGVVNLKGGGSVKAPAGGATNSVAVTISDGARMKIESRYNTSGCAGLCVQIPSAITLVTGRGSKLSSSVNSSSCYAGPLWFRYVGNQELKVIDGGRLEANFWEHPTNSTAALRFGPASGNAFTCRSGGSVHIYNAGNGTANNGTGADATGNMAIEYAQNGFIFDIDGEKSSVELVADWGPAINAKNFTDGVINCNNGAIFSARGCTADSTEGIFRAGSNLKMNVNNPLYFDFTNTKSGGGQIFAINSNSASNNPSFSLTNSNLSIWRKGHESWNGTPWKSWIMATLALSGSNFTTATTSNPPDMGPCFTGSFSATPPDNNMRNYTRLSSNNAPAHITDVLPATNADKYIRAIAMVPEGFSQTLRGAYDNEVSAIFKITPASGSAPYQVTASSTESERVYGENMKGVVRYELPAPYYLATGDEIEVVDAWIGPANAKNPGSGVRYIQSPAEDITTEAVTVEDKSPPLPGAITTQTFYANQKKVEGTWSLDESYNADPPVKIVAYQNGSLIKEAGVPVYGLVSGSGSGGVWSFTFPSSCNIQAGDLMQFALEDAAGNRVYPASTAYHDRTFAAAPGITVQPVLYDISCDDVYVGTAQAIGLEPSSPGAFIDMNSAKGYDLSKPEGSRDKALSVDASSWTREWENWAGYPPFRSKAYEISYSIEGEPSFAKTAKITVVNAEKVGNRYGIGASRIDSINPEKAKSITDAELISLAGAFAFDVTDGEQAEIEVEGRDFPADGTSCGTGTVSFRAVAEPDTSTTVDVVVSRKNPPVLTVSSPAIVTMGGSFDYADNICACDAEDGDITSKVKWEGTVDTDKAGIYTLAYQVTDSDYNTAEATRIVIVQDGSFVLGDEYILQARNFAVRMDEALATDEEILGKSMAQAWEAGTGAPANDKLYVVSDGGYRDEAKTEAKDYAITVGATGDAAARCGITGKVMKKDIIGENAYYIITADNVSLPQSVAKIQLSPLSKLLGLANVQALKKSDMTQTPARLGANNVNADAIGSYTASYMVDAAPEVNVQGRVDITKGGAPTISLDPVTDMVAAGSAAEYGYMDGVSASDPEDGDITGKVAVTGSVDMDKAGVYTVTYSVEDADGNADSRVRVVAVNDGTFIATPSYILRARSFVIRAGEVEGADISSQIISRSKAQAWDAVTGAEADAMVLSAGGYGPAQGTYDIVIAAEADRSVARSLKATVVSDETAVDAGDYWIVGNPIRINSTADKAIPHPDFVALCKVRAFKADDSLTPGTPVLDSYTGSYDGTQGDFFAGFHVAEEPSNKLENLKVTVTDGQRPTLTVDPMVINLDKGAEALTYGDYMDGVSASDAEDTAAGRPLVVTYEGTVNTEVSGLYHIKYSVTDSDFNTVSLTRYYAVGAKIHLLGPYFLCAGDYWINSNGVIASPAADRDAQIIAASKAAAYDSDMEATTGAIVLVADAGGYRQLEEGEGARVFTVSLALDKAPGLTAPVKVMVGNNVVAGDRYSIAANDFSISMGEVSSITEAKLIEWAKAKAFRNSDFSEAAVKVAGNNILASPGEYSVTFKATEEPATMTTVKMHISSVPAPVISLESPVRLSVGESFDPLRGVTAEDYRHADITAKVEVTANNVNILKAGVYHADYSVKDDYGNETTARRVVAVNDGSYSVGDRYIVHAVNFVLSSRDVDIAGKEAQIKAKGEIKAWDALTGEEVTASINDDGGYRNLTDGEEQQDFTIVAGAALDAGTPEPGRAVRSITAKVVNKTVLAGENYTIAASSFTINPVDETGITDAQLIARAGGQAWKNSDFSPAQVEALSYAGSRSGVKGIFDLSLAAAAEKATKITVPVSVTEGAKPVLTVTPAALELPLKTVFDPMAGVSAADAEDDLAGIPLEITFAAIGDAVDTSAKGIYKVRYSVTDSDHNTVTADRVVAVGLIAGAKYYLDAGNFTLLLKETAGTEEEILARSGARAWDKFTGAPVSGLLRVADSGGYRQEAGEYPITIGVSGDVPVKAITGRIVEGDKIVTASGYTIVARNVSLPRSVAQASFDNAHLLSWAKVRAWRDTDNTEVPAKVKSHTVDVSATGFYHATYAAAEDITGKAEIEAKVDITDGVPPTLTVSPDPDEVALGSAPYEYMNGVTAIDDEDGDITGDIKVSGDSVDTGKAGVYKVTYAVTDSDYNTVSVDRVIVVSDGTYGVGRNFIVRANGFVLSRSEADSLRPHEQILERSGAMAWDAATGKEVAAAILDDGGYYVSDGSDVQSFKIRIGAEGDSATMPENERANVDITARVINKDYVVTGERYAIGADNFKINRTDELGVTNATLIARAKAEAWRIDGGPGSAEAEVFQYGGRRDGTAGNYGLTFDVAQEPETKVAVKVSVTDGQAPQLSVKPSLVHLEIGQGFDYMDGVSAFDAEDGDLSSGIIVSGAVDNSRQGVYPVAYTVTDSDHNRAEDVRIYVVGGGMAIGEEYIVTAGDFTASLKDMSGGDAEILTLSGARAWDKLTGAPADEVVSVIDGGGYRKAAGTYDITVGIDGDANAWRPVKATVEGDDIVISNDFPVLTVAPNPEEVAADGGAYGYMKGVSAADTEDDAALLPITITYTGTVDTSKAGVYKVTYTATDSDGNSVQAVRVVIVNDGSIISGPGYMLRAGSFSANVMDIKGGADEILRLSGAEAWDKNGEPAVPEVKASGGYRRAGGLYSVTIGIAGRAGSPTTIIYASVSADSYTVIFDGNGADRRPIPGSLMVTQPAASVTSLPSAPARTGYSFAGWSTAKDGSGAKFEASTAVSSNMTVYAMWAANRYRLSFDLNGGKGAVPAAQTLSFGAQANAVKDPKVRKGFTFKGWNTAKDGSGAYWNFRAETMPARNVTLYAQWLKTKKIIKEVEVVVEKPRIKVEKTGGSGSMYTGRPVSPKSAGPVATPNPGNAATSSSAAVTSSAHEEPEPAAYDVAGSGSVGVDAVDTGLDMGTGENAAGKVGGWSAADLLMAIAGLVMAVFGIIAMALRRKIAGFRAGVMNITGLLVAIAAAVCNGVILLALEDFSGPMVVTGKFTPIMAIGLAAALVGLIAALVRADSREYE